MKTKNLWIMLAALALASCSQNEITDVSPDANPVVGFSVYTGVQTKGLVTNGNASSSNVTTGLQTAGFGVLAYYTGQESWATNTSSHKPTFMYNQEVTYSGGWTYSPAKYWPNTAGDKISFFAYGPYESSVTNGSGQGIKIDAVNAIAGGAPTLKFTLKDAGSAMVDLVATDATQTSPNKTIDLEKSTSKVPFKFNHVLSRANFKAKLDAAVTSSETQVFIKDIKILGTSAETPAAAESNSKFYKSAIYKWADGTWDYTVSGDTKAVLQTTAYSLDKGTNKVLKTTAASFGGYTKESVAVSTTTATDLFNTNQYLFLIPPTNTGIASEKDIRVLLIYDVVTVDTKLDGGHSAVETKAVVSLSNGTLQKGKAYNYIFTIGLEKVTVDASVADWDTTAGTDADAPSVTSTDATATNVLTAIGAMNTAKNANKNCNYFVVNIANANISSAYDISTAANYSNFVAGDQIELNFTGSSSVTVSHINIPTVWTKSGSDITTSTDKVMLKKNS